MLCAQHLLERRSPVLQNWQGRAPKEGMNTQGAELCSHLRPQSSALLGSSRLLKFRTEPKPALVCHQALLVECH